MKLEHSEKVDWLALVMLGGLIVIGLLSLPVGRALWCQYLGIDELKRRVDALETKWVPDK